MLHHNWSLYLFHSELKYNSRTDSLTANMFIKSQCFRLIDFFPRKQRISLYSSMQTHIHTVYFQSSNQNLMAYKLTSFSIFYENICTGQKWNNG